MGIKVRPGLVYFCLGPPGAAVLLNMLRFCDEEVCNPDELSFGGWISRCSCILSALVDPFLEDLGFLAGVVRLLKAGIVFCEVCYQYYGLVHVEVSDEADCGDGIISCDGVIEGGLVCVLKNLEWLMKERGFHRSPIVLLSTGLFVPPEGAILFGWGVHARMVGAQPIFVGQMKGSGLVRA